MHVILLIVPTIIIALALFAVGWRALRSRRARAFTVVASVVLAGPALLFVAYYLHILDAAEWFYVVRTMPFVELSAAGAGLGCGAIAGTLSRRSFAQGSLMRTRMMLISSTLCLCLLLVVPYIKPMVAPLTIELRDRWSEGVCLQSTPSTCGPSCAATLLRTFGMAASERELADECFSYRGGTEIWYIARAFNRRGLGARYIVGSPMPIVPSIAGVRLGDANGPGHFVAIMACDGERFVVGDPLVERLTLTLDELRTRYHLTGFFLGISKPVWGVGRGLPGLINSWRIEIG